mmetsp:Transcript_54760/g.150953  ORF Transcript_54760/g.150953 Transcript_54760/m.150953 type:complete len:282 (-) Transcript_54760:1014-1859(-)
MRWTRPMACASSAGFKHGSSRKTWLAWVKLIPTAPARMLRRKMVVGGSFWNSSRALLRAARDMSPASERQEKPCWPNLTLRASMVLVNWEKTSDFAVGSSALTRANSFSSTANFDSRTVDSQSARVASLTPKPGSIRPPSPSPAMPPPLPPGFGAEGLSFFTVMLVRHTGQSWSCTSGAELSVFTMHSWQKLWPHWVVVGDSISSRQIGHSSGTSASASLSFAFLPPPRPCTSSPAAAAAAATRLGGIMAAPGEHAARIMASMASSLIMLRDTPPDSTSVV